MHLDRSWKIEVKRWKGNWIERKRKEEKGMEWKRNEIKQKRKQKKGKECNKKKRLKAGK